MITRQDTHRVQHCLRVNGNSIEHHDRSNLDEIRSLQKMLRKGEKVVAITFQPRMLPGSCYVTPNIIYATNRRIIIVDPHVPDFQGGKVSIPYNIMTSIKLEEGPYATLAIKFESPTLINTMGLGKIHGIAGGKNRNERTIDAIPRTKAEELMNAIL
ncbi:MAG: PH domain-containing protein, partial [Nitrososphaeraceae archaeon]